MADSTYDDDSTICPYCEHPHHQEAEDFDDHEHEETCEECGETFLAYDEATVTHYARKKPNASDQATASLKRRSHDRHHTSRCLHLICSALESRKTYEYEDPRSKGSP